MTPDATSRRVNFPEDQEKATMLSELRQKLKSQSVNRNGRLSNRNHHKENRATAQGFLS